MQRLAFYTHDDPRGMEDEEATPYFQRMSAREHLDDFDKKLKGCFSAKLIGMSSANELGLYVPFRQEGYGDLNERPRERNKLAFTLLQGRKLATKLPMVLRRAIQLYTFPVPPTIYTAESSMEANYSIHAVNAIQRKWPLFTNPLESAKPKEFLQMILLPGLIDKGRLRYLLYRAGRRMKVEHVEGRKFLLRFIHPRSEQEEIFLQATVGETAVIKVSRDPKDLGIRLYVNSQNERGVSVSSLARDGFTAQHNQQQPQPNPLLQHVGRVFFVKFELSNFKQRVIETGAVDGWTACGARWIDGVSLDFTGTPSINQKQLDRLKRGDGYFHSDMNDEQRQAVVKLLTHKAEQTVFSIIAPPGTGKTMVVLEAICQITEYHEEETPGAALIVYAANTNLNVRVTAEKLLRLGYPPQKMLILVGERLAAMQPDVNQNELPIRTVRITEYQPNPEVQLLLSTYLTISKAGLGPEWQHTIFRMPTKHIFVDEVTQLSVAGAIALFALTGEPDTYTAVGDKMQNGNHCLSRTASMLYGEACLLDALHRHKEGYYNLAEPYLTPRYFFGASLLQNHRACTFLVNMDSELFYGGKMIPSEHCARQDQITSRYARQCRDSNVLPLCLITSVITWFDFEGHVTRNPVTGSLFNPQEAKMVVSISMKMAELVGDSRILILSAYKAQVNLLIQLLPQGSGIRVASVDETQGLEADIVCISMVRSRRGAVADSTNAGFLADPRRANVMLSRARNLILVVGSADHFWESGSEHWHAFMRNWATIMA